MTEDYLQHAWLFLNFNTNNLLTADNEKIKIVDKGVLNYDSGPDFLNAKIEIDGTLWVGHVEVHVKSSMWNQHKHQFDPAYNNVILHIVLEDDVEILNQNGEAIPVLELKNRIREEHYQKYFDYISLAAVYPCSGQLEQVSSIKISSWFNRLAFERMMLKVDQIVLNLERLNNDWDHLMYLYLARALGMKVNQDAMEQLVLKTPFRVVQKESFSLFSLEALFFGQSGLLKNQTDSFAKELSEEYFYLKQKYNLQAMEGVEWKFSRMRPANFPTLRIAQLAAIFNQYNNLFALIRDKEDISVIKKVLSPHVSYYWLQHYKFGEESLKITGAIGERLKNSIVINVIIPVTIAYGKYIDDISYIEYGMELLEKIEFEQNKKTRFWEKVDGVPKNALGSQAAIRLLDQYCLNKKCLSCSIGIDILKK